MDARDGQQSESFTKALANVVPCVVISRWNSGNRTASVVYEVRSRSSVSTNTMFGRRRVAARVVAAAGRVAAPKAVAATAQRIATVAVRRDERMAAPGCRRRPQARIGA